MKKTLTLLLLLSAFMLSVNAQVMIIENGGFDDASGWTVYDQDGDPAAVEFGYTADGPAAGDGVGLRISGSSAYVNALVFQSITLKAGKTYAVSAAFKDLAGGLAGTFWSQIYIDPEAPVDTLDWKPPAGSNIPLTGFNGWGDCTGEGIDGTYEADGCDGLGTNIYTAPGYGGSDTLVYFGIKTGVWADPGPATFDIVIDEVSLVEVPQINWDFETDTTTIDIWSWGSATPVIVANPAKTFYNMSDSVVQCQTGTSAWGWGLNRILPEELLFTPESDTVVTIKVLAEVAAPVLMKFEEGGTPVETWGDYTTPGAWQEITFALDAPADTLTKLIFWFDPEVTLGTEIDFYIDDIIQKDQTVRLYCDYELLYIPWEVFPEGLVYGTEPNPLPEGINKSENVGYTLTGADTWDGAYIYTDGFFDFTKDTVFTMDVASESTGTVMFKLEEPGKGNDGLIIENRQEYTTPGEWVTMRYAFPDAALETYGAMVIFFDMDQANEGNDWYFDNIQGPPIKLRDWGCTVNLTIVDETGASSIRADIWWNPGEDYNEEDPNTHLLNMELTDDDADGTWTGSILVPWTNTFTGIYVTNQYCVVADDEKTDVCDVEFIQEGWDGITEDGPSLTDTLYAEVAVEDLRMNEIAIYPNPVTEVLNLSNAGNIQSVHINSIVGQRVISLDNIKSGNLKINVSTLERGVYLLNLVDRKGTIRTHKIIKR